MEDNSIKNCTQAFIRALRRRRRSSGQRRNESWDAGRGKEGERSDVDGGGGKLGDKRKRAVTIKSFVGLFCSVVVVLPRLPPATDHNEWW